VIACLVSACSFITRILPTAAPVVGVEVSNGTTLDVTLVVNGAAVRVIAPGTGTSEPIKPNELGPMPWFVEARTSSGRVLLKLTVNPGDVVYEDLGGGRSSSRSDGARVDLSCGRLDVWAGAPMIGPAPGPGVPGDCAP
jgi:hypothetical protein